jgi:hypothetical protein
MTTLRPIRSPSTQRTSGDAIRGGKKKDRRRIPLPKWQTLVRVDYSRLDLDEIWDRMDEE